MTDASRTKPSYVPYIQLGPGSTWALRIAELPTEPETIRHAAAEGAARPLLDEIAHLNRTLASLSAASASRAATIAILEERLAVREEQLRVRIARVDELEQESYRLRGAIHRALRWMNAGHPSDILRAAVEHTAEVYRA